MKRAEQNRIDMRELMGRLDRRDFFKDLGVAGLTLAGAGASAATLSAKPLPSTEGGGLAKVPKHLPQRLTICPWLWAWWYTSLPGEPFHDLDQVLAEHEERAFNAIRVDVALDACFDQQGNPRGEVEFVPFITGLDADAIAAMGGGGSVRYNMLERVLSLYELAKKHNVYIVQTSWAYQDSTTNLADPKLRADIFSTPVDQRFERLARLHNRLIEELKKHGLEKQIAFVEIHNELNASDFPTGWLAQKPLVEKALAEMQQAHPDILITADYVNVGPLFEPDFPGFDALPHNMQVADHHVYTFGIEKALCDLTNTWMGDQVPDLKSNALLRWLVRDKPRISWDEWSKAAVRMRRAWWPMMWLFVNVDIDRYDYWMLEHFGEYAGMMTTLIQSGIRDWGFFARQRNLPAVVDEGYIFDPPRYSHFEDSAAGRMIFERVVELTMEQGYWGMMLSTYIMPLFPIWKENPGWIRKANERFLNSASAQRT